MSIYPLHQILLKAPCAQAAVGFNLLKTVLFALIDKYIFRFITKIRFFT